MTTEVIPAPRPSPESVTVICVGKGALLRLEQQSGGARLGSLVLEVERSSIPDTRQPETITETPTITNKPASSESTDGRMTVTAEGEEVPYPETAPAPEQEDPAWEVWNLVERVQSGDKQAFGEIYDRYLDTVFRFIYFRVGNRQLAEDLTSDTFLRALKRIDSFTWQGKDLGAWLVTISRNLVADHFKSARNRLETTTRDLHEDRVDRSPEGNPAALTLDHLTNLTLLQAVQQLNPEQQDCIILRFLNDFSVAETARIMGKTEGAIKAMQSRAIRTLGRLLPDDFGES